MLKNLVAFDVVSLVGDSLASEGWYVDPQTNKYSCKGRAFHKTDPPWIYTNPIPGTPCTVYQKIVDQAGFIPNACLNCWKVVVKPFTLYELMQLYQWQEEFIQGRIGKGHYCKCGIEVRKYVPQNYGGYFYCKSKEHGLHRWQQVREAVNDINPEIPVTLKRYCTEFEIRLGPSDQYKRPDNADDLEKAIFNAIDVKTMGKPKLQPDWIKSHVIKSWIEHAWDRSDHTAILFNDNEPLYTPAVTYHQRGNE